MRRSDREITDKDELISVIRKCDVCRIALNDGGYPYIIPLNFGFCEKDGSMKFYFHSALEGKKLDLIKKDPRAGFELDCSHMLQYFEEKGYCTMAYKSVVGTGRINILDDNEKTDALNLLMKQYHPEGYAGYDPAAMSRTTVFCLTVESITGKKKNPK